MKKILYVSLFHVLVLPTFPALVEVRKTHRHPLHSHVIHQPVIPAMGLKRPI